jgi:hypothetical protein
MLYVLMVLCAAVMIYANGQAKSKGKGAAWGRPVAGLFGMMTIGTALLKIVLIVDEPKKQPTAIIEKELRYAYAQMQYLGDYLGENHSGETILLVTPPPSEDTAEHHKILVDALREGLKGRLTICAEAYPENPDETEEVVMKYENFFTAEVFGAMLAKNETCTLILSLIQLPTDFEEMEFWKLEEDQRPKLVLVKGNIYNLKKAIMGGYVNAVLHYKPNFKYEINEEVPTDYKEAFAKRYLIIDKTNIEAISAEHPNLFRPDEEGDEKPEE